MNLIPSLSLKHWIVVGVVFAFVGIVLQMFFSAGNRLPFVGGVLTGMQLRQVRALAPAPAPVAVGTTV